MELIKNIEIKNFKSIRHQKIEDCRRINVFIGYPNVGKSNILEALSLFAVNQETNLTDLIRVKEDPTIFFNGFIENLIMVSLNDVYGVFGEYIDNKLSLSFQVASEDGSFSKEKLNPVLSKSVIKELRLKNFTFSESSELNKSDIPGKYIIKKYEFRKEYLPKGVNYSSLQYPFGGNIFPILYTNESLKNDSSDLLKEYDLELLYDTRNQNFTILKRTGKGIFTVPYELLAETLQRLIFYKAAIYSNKERILLFEEPEAHMFPPYISKLTSDIWFNKENQYFITTHSPFVVNDFLENAKDELAVYIVEYNKGESVIKRLSDEQTTEAYQYGIDLFFNLESLSE